MICVNDKGESCKYSHDVKIDEKMVIDCLACCRAYGYNSREEAQALNEFADNLERIEKKYSDSQKKVISVKKCKYYLNPDYTRCHECKTERNE